jgi:predicted dehydrogenase
VKALLVGLGSIGRRHARNWAALGVGPLAICRQRGGPLPEPLGLEISEYDDLDQALGREQPDVVIVTNPTSLHMDAACAALRAAAHVFVEKPLSNSLDRVSDLLDDAAVQHKHVMVGYNLRFHPGLQRLKELLQEGVIGTVVSARAEAGEFLPDWHPWEDYRDSYSGRRDLGGGAVLTFSHELDALCWLLGAPRQITALAAHASSLEIDTEDVCDMVLQYDHGCAATVHVDYVRRPPTRTIELVGERGVLRWDYTANRVDHYDAAGGQWCVEEGDPRFERNDMYVAELRHFVDCVREDVEPPLIDGEQGAAIVVLALAALRSSAEGRTIDLRTQGEPIASWLSSLGPD